MESFEGEREGEVVETKNQEQAGQGSADGGLQENRPREEDL